jgi:hypothetical protein
MLPEAARLYHISDWDSFVPYVSKTCAKAFCGLHEIGQIRKFLSADECLQKCSCRCGLTPGLLQCPFLWHVWKEHQSPIQRVLNAAARVVSELGTAIWPSCQHWWSFCTYFRFRIRFKIVLLVFKAWSANIHPDYVHNQLTSLQNGGRIGYWHYFQTEIGSDKPFIASSQN